MPEIRGKQEVHKNGWQNVAIWSGGQSTGDDTCGEEFTVYYELTGTAWRAEVTFYTVVSPRGCDWEDAEGYAVDERTEIFKAVLDENGEMVDQEDVSIDYEGGSYLSYPTIELADKEGERMARINFDHAFADREFFENKDKEEAHGT